MALVLGLILHVTSQFCGGLGLLRRTAACCYVANGTAQSSARNILELPKRPRRLTTEGSYKGEVDGVT